MSGKSETIPVSEELNAAAPQYTVVYFDSDGAKTHVLRRDEAYTIGRSDSCDIVIKRTTVSSRHAVVIGSSPPTIKDLGSRNGTHVSSRTITPHTLVPIDVGSVVQIGDVVLFVQRSHDESPFSDRSPRQTEESSEERRTPPPEPPAHAREALIVRSQRMRELLSMARIVAASDLTVLIIGETGVGKERLAQSIHAASSRASQPVISLNCAAFPENLVESELFGYERGAFTGAAKPKRGLIGAAEGGTLFLDEVGELTLPIQAKLLRVLEARELLPLGATKVTSIDVRFIAATNRGLTDAIASGRFREDLYYRLNGVTLEIPPLRERRDDIMPLAEHFGGGFAAQLRRPPPSFSTEATEAILAYAWPGNIRELKNVIERATLLATSGVIEANAIPKNAPTPSLASFGSFDDTEHETSVSMPTLPGDSSPESTLGKRRIFGRDEMLLALKRAGGDQTEAAKLLGVSRRTLINWLDKFELPRPRKRPGS
jgi:transcriptional regulator with PAS, ATPase and Fis domain